VPQPATRSATQPATQPVDPNHVVARFGDQKLTVAELESFIADLPPREQAMARGPGRRELAEYIMRVKLLATEAERRQLPDSPKVKRQMEFFRQQVLANALANDVQEKVDDAAIEKYFNEHRQELEKIQARHILIRTPKSPVPLKEGQPEPTEEQAKAKADEIYKRVSGGEDFAKVARAESADTRSGADGGDLGPFGRGRMIPEFEKAAFALKEGEISQPVKSEFGWHVIQLTKRFDTLATLGAEAKDQIKAALGPQRMSDLVKELEKNAKVELDESYLGPAQPRLDPRMLGGQGQGQE
jgi:parvulin-like peptidyl-prolyl isomerase